MRLPADLLVRSPEEAARLLALSYLDEAARAVDRLADSADTEALHDFRVGLRRLRSCCRAFTSPLEGSVSRRARRRLRRLTNATNAARDAEVQLAWLHQQAEGLDDRGRDELAVLIDRLDQRKREAYQVATGRVKDRFGKIADELRDSLAVYRARIRTVGARQATTFGQLAGGLIRRQALGLGTDLASVHQLADVKEAHVARIAAKRLRYLLEPLQRRSRLVKALVERLKGLQDALGDLHDMQVLDEAVAAAVEEVAARGARRLHAMALEGRSDEAGDVVEQVDDERTGLAEVGRLVRARSEELFATLESEWLAGRAEPFLQRVDALGERLAGRPSPEIEMERKYLLDTLPAAVHTAPAVAIEQGWLPGTDLEERIRVTRSGNGDRYWRALKFGSGIARTEIEEETTAQVFDAFWPLTQGRRVRKRRYLLPAGDLTWEIDEFTDRELVLAEVELPSEDTPVDVPDWLGPHVVREVTGDPAYVNINLAR